MAFLSFQLNFYDFFLEFLSSVLRILHIMKYGFSKLRFRAVNASNRISNSTTYRIGNKSNALQKLFPNKKNMGKTWLK